jgi:hypothetical protein
MFSETEKSEPCQGGADEGDEWRKENAVGEVSVVFEAEEGIGLRVKEDIDVRKRAGGESGEGNRREGSTARRDGEGNGDTEGGMGERVHV